ncbi:MAG: sugar ABC transporter substrate-binding protein [Chloroflexi bacterium]|nr:sugar ABC transporter substrate-binding protein [Chloroflexota bacterium]
MSSKRVSIWLSLLVLFSLLISACGGAAAPAAPVAEEAAPAEAAATEAAPEEATEAPTEEAVSEAPAAEAAAEGDVAIRWRTRPDNQEEAGVYQSISDEIDAKLEGIGLAYEPGGSEGASYQDQLKTEIANGTAPDVFWIPGTDVADFAKRGLILNLAGQAANTEGYSNDDFYAGPMNFLTYNPETDVNDALWGLPRDVSTFVLYLNQDLLAEAGAPDPIALAAEGNWDWDAFVEVAAAVRGLGSDIYGYGANAWWGPYGTWMNAAGGGFFNADRTACNLNSPESLAGLEFEQRLYQDLDVAVPYGEDSEPPFRAGKVGMFQNGRWATPGIRTVDFNWDVVELPKGPAGNAGNWQFWGAYAVNANTEHPEEAWKLVQELTQAETQAKISALGTNIPSRVSQEAIDAFLTFTPPANNQAFINGLQDNAVAEGPLWKGDWPSYVTVMDSNVQALMTGEKSIDDFAATICDEADKTFQ